MNGLIATDSVVYFAGLPGALPAGAPLSAALPPALLAQTSAPATKPFLVGLLETPMFPIFVIILLLWVFMFRSKRREDNKKKELLGAIKRGDRVQTIGGILGKVVEVEKEKILLKVDESSNTKIWFSRNAIFRVVAEEKVEPAKV